jgi:YidC/Oxa1 family membrane protein insertase
MEKRVVLAIVLSLLVVVAWSYLFAPSQTPQPPVGPSERVADQAPSQAPTPTPRLPVPVPPAATAPAVNAATVTVDTGVAQLTLTGLGAGVKAVSLRHYHTSLDPGSPPIVISPVPEATVMPLASQLEVRGQRVPLGQVMFTPSHSDIHLSPDQPEATVTFQGTTPDGIVVHRTYRFHYNRYVFDVGTWVEGIRSAPGDTMSLFWGPGLFRATDETVNRQGQTKPLPRSYVNGKVHELALKEAGQTQVVPGKVSWATLGDTYFAAVLLPQEPAADAAIVQLVREGVYEVGVRTPLGDANAPQTVEVYVGPKAHRVLDRVDPSLTKIIDLGFFSVLARPMLQLLIAFNSWIHNYGITIILVTILIKIVLWPLTQTSSKSMRAMQKLQPKMKDLQVRYKDDRQGLNRAMMDLYRENKVNPMGGCLPMLLQIPVFFAFYNALLYSIELRHAPFICWETFIWWLGRGICDLSVYDPSYITPLLMGATMFLQQRMMPTTTADPTQAKLMQFMPLMFLFFFLKAPAGLVIYWLVNNVLSIVQQVIINRMGEQEEARAKVVSQE